jgi:hypothetical protein
MKKAFVIMLKRRYSAVSVLNTDCIAQLQFTVKGSAAMQFELERKGPGDNNFFVVKRFNVSTPGFGFNTVSIKDTLDYRTGGGITYRLKHILGTDTSFYYDTQVLNLAQPCGNNKILISPNPVKDNLKVSIGAILNISNPVVRVTASDGKVVYRSALNNGNNDINTRNWAAGIYLVEVISNKEVIAKKRIVKG